MECQYYYLSLFQSNEDIILQLNDDNLVNLNTIFKEEIIDMNLIHKILTKIDRISLINYIKTNKADILARKLWFLYEYYINSLDEIADLSNVMNLTHESILNDELQITLNVGEISKRHYIINNMISSGKLFICIERTHYIKDNENVLKQLLKSLNKNDEISPERINSHIYKKETKFSYLIENETIEDSNNVLYDKLNSFEFNKQELIKLQNDIVTDFYKSKDWRNIQSYVGGTSRVRGYSYREIYDYICPKPNDVGKLMQWLFELNEKLNKSDIDLTIYASILSFLFVYIHPFNDGNGRISRFLINWLLYKQKLNILPLSAVIYNNITNYHDALNEFSVKIEPHIEYNKNRDGSIQVLDDTIQYYQFINLTKQTEYLFKTLIEAKYYYLCEFKFLSIFDDMKANFPLIESNYLVCLIRNGKIGSKKQKRAKVDLNQLIDYFERNFKSKLDDSFHYTLNKINKQK